ncbi:MAG: glycosyltransferase family 39 protein, partial [Candidatus Eremiobacteraeota bacterium]|nr:glycosyltransferase family 39 protein [Candidatus Eremiobacteraeota bacterium]
MASRTALAADLSRSGVIPLAGVCAGGATLGFFAFYAFVTHVHRGAFLAETVFIASIPAGIAVAIALWQGYARYFARRTGVSLELALTIDAVSWTLLILMWVGFLGTFGASATGRGIAVALGAFALGKLIAAARFNRSVKDVAITFLVTRAPIILIAELAAVTIGQRPGIHVATSSNPALAVWGRWDAVHYIQIAAAGYYGTDMAFFPLYPLIISLIAKLTGSHLIAGLILSNVALFFALLFFYKLVEHQYNRHVAQRAVFYISIFPTAVFFSAVYTESLFLALTVASFYYIREHKWLIAGIIGYCAALTRVEGVLLAVPFAIEWLRSPAAAAALRYPADNIVRPLVGLVLIPLGLGTYMLYLWVLRGDPLFFSHVQINWNRHLAPPWQSVLHSYRLLATAHSGQVIANQFLELAFTALMLAMLVVAIRRLSATYWTYMALSILIPMSTSSLMSMPRFALVLFPIFALFGLWGAKPNINNAILAFSMPLLGLFTV